MERTYTKAAIRRKKIRYVGSSGFKRRLRWTHPFAVAIYRVEHASLAVAA
jgi:hypothetical protein